MKSDCFIKSWKISKKIRLFTLFCFNMIATFFNPANSNINTFTQSYKPNNYFIRSYIINI